MSGRPPALGADATLALLWERVRRGGDMPGFARSVGAILAAMRGESDLHFNMTRTVLSDPVLTQKVLRLANSGMYAAFGQRINTVSKAVLVLGTEAIGHLALGLKLIEELAHCSPNSALAHAEMEKAVLAGMLAQTLATGAGAPDPEQAVVCAMLHSLGRLMLAFYLPEHWAVLQVEAPPGAEDAAVPAQLGLSVEAIGRAAAQHWGLPPDLVECMACVEPATALITDQQTWLAALSTLAARTAQALWQDNPAGNAALHSLAEGYGPMLGLALPTIMLAVAQARESAATGLTLAPMVRKTPANGDASGNAGRSRILQSGVNDMRELAGHASAGQMMSTALATVYEGLDLARAMVFLRQRREQRYVAKMGFGVGVPERIGALAFDDNYHSDVFHAALSSDTVIFIEDASDPAFGTRLPPWWKAALAPARSFVILPLSSNGQPAGFLYGDWLAGDPPVQLGRGDFVLLNDLRALVMQVVERRRQAELAAARER